MNERTKNIKRNLFFGIISKIVLLLLGFAERTIVIYILGIEFLGITSLFKSVLDVLSLAEFGFGAAMVYSMYQPIAQNDTQKVNALLAYYRKCYHVVGSIIFMMGFVLMPFIKYLIKGDVPTLVNIYIVYLLTLINTCLSYFLWAYKSSVFVANQRNDIVSKCTMAASLVGYVLKIICLILSHSYYVFIVASLSINVINNVLVYCYSNKMYPQYKPEGTLAQDDKATLRDKLKGLFVYKIGNIVSNSADNIVVSAYLGLTILAQYNNYYYIISTLFGLFNIYYNSITASLGNSMVMESTETNHKIFTQMVDMQNWIVGFCSIALLCLFQPFIKLWVGVENMLDMTTVVLLAFYFYIWKIQDMVTIFKEALGMWDKDRLRPLIGALFNLGLNFILVQYIGLYGVILSTSISQIVIGFPWQTRILFRNYFEMGAKGYYIQILRSILITLLIGYVTYNAVQIVPEQGITGLVLKAVICVFVSNTIYGIWYLRKRDFRNYIRKIICVK